MLNFISQTWTLQELWESWVGKTSWMFSCRISFRRLHFPGVRDTVQKLGMQHCANVETLPLLHDNVQSREAIIKHFFMLRALFWPAGAILGVFPINNRGLTSWDAHHIWINAAALSNSRESSGRVFLWNRSIIVLQTGKIKLLIRKRGYFSCCCNKHFGVNLAKSFSG